MKFGFLFNPILRTLFYGIMAATAYSYDSVLGYASFGCTLACAAFNFYVIVKYPEYKEERDKLAKEEDAKIDKVLKEEARRQISEAALGK